MFISKFSVENWQGNRNQGAVEPVRNWEQIATAIAEIDGQRKTLVTLETDNETHMAIGGGQGRYLVYLTFDNENFYYLVDRSAPNRAEILVVGGQAGSYSARSCVTIEVALQAAKTFAEFGEMERSLTWQRDSAVELV